jgi:pimeloyl-ACP methyl ester carboxylesterase
MRRLFFLPGVGGSAIFWRPLGDRLPAEWDKTYFGWPGLGNNPPDPDVNSYDDLVALVEAQLGDGPVDILAQSMGGAIALSVTLRNPDMVRRLVLAVTAGGMDVSALGASDWRDDYRAEFPNVADWVMDQRPDVSTRLGEVNQPCLLIWGDNDPISPLAVGKYFEAHLPDARLVVVPGGQHDLIAACADEVAGTVQRFLS